MTADHRRIVVRHRPRKRLELVGKLATTLKLFIKEV